MRRKRWLWLAFAALCALAVAIGYLSRPEDNYAFLRPYQPTEQLVEVKEDLITRGPPHYWIHKFTFPPQATKAAEEFLDTYSTHYTFNDWELIDFPGGE